jgi:two-component system NtrC family sensor kinase
VSNDKLRRESFRWVELPGNDRGKTGDIMPKTVDNKTRRSKQSPTTASGFKSIDDFSDLSHRILHHANRGVSKFDFLCEVSKILLDFSGCDAVELRQKKGDYYYLSEVTRNAKPSPRFEIMSCARDELGQIIPCSLDDSDHERLCRYIVLGKPDSSFPSFTKKGSFWTGDAEALLPIPLGDDGEAGMYDLSIKGNYRSIAMIPIVIDTENVGLLELKSKKRDYFTKTEIEFYEDIARILGDALLNRRAQAALRERIKELTCLYGIAQVVEQQEVSLGGILRDIVMLLPPAWQYPECTVARITLDGRSYTTPNFQEALQKQTEDIVINGEYRGVIEVGYTERIPQLAEGPFLKEEQSLLNAVARQVALIIERMQAQEEKSKLQEQLRHADRLATIGQLAAGVAHELNEPLGNILGFAQLVTKASEVPEQVGRDVEKIVSASLHARDVVKKLLIFARQMPPSKTKVDLNRLIEEGLSFFESRCVKEGIEIKRLLSPDLPEITADPSQLNQVLVNLVVNAAQAMPEGGTLTIQTCADETYVLLIVEDSGVGMSEEILKKIFIPFFTTKDVGQGTGLGLSVVHGIVTSHGGSIEVDSHVGRGARFQIQLPVSGPQQLKENEGDGPIR